MDKLCALVVFASKYCSVATFTVVCLSVLALLYDILYVF